MFEKSRSFWSELRKSGWRLVPAARIEAMQFVVDGTTASARVATARYMRMGRVLELCAKDLANHPGSGPKRMAQTQNLRRLIRQELDRTIGLSR